MESLDTRLLGVNCLFYDKNEDKRFHEFSFPIVRSADGFRKLMETRNITIVVVNLVDIDHDDIKALADSNRLKGGQLTFIAIEGNLQQNVSNIINRKVSFSRVLPKEVDSRRLKFAISYFDNRHKFESLVASQSKERIDVETEVQDNARKEGAGGASRGLISLFKAACAVFISVISIYGKNGFMDECSDPNDPTCAVSSESIAIVSERHPGAKSGVKKNEGAGASVFEEEMSDSLYLESNSSAPKVKFKVNFEDDEILAFTQLIDQHVDSTSIEAGEIGEEHLNGSGLGHLDASGNERHQSKSIAKLKGGGLPSLNSKKDSVDNKMSEEGMASGNSRLSEKVTSRKDSSKNNSSEKVASKKSSDKESSSKKVASHESPSKKNQSKKNQSKRDQSKKNQSKKNQSKKNQSKKNQSKKNQSKKKQSKRSSAGSEKELAKSDLRAIMKSALVQIRQKRYLSKNGDGAVDYLKKVDRKTEKGAKAADSMATAILYTVLDEYIHSAKNGDMKRMRKLHLAVSELKSYVDANRLGLMKTDAFVNRMGQFFTEIEVISKAHNGQEFHNLVAEIRHSFSGVVYAKKQKKPIRRTGRMILD